MIPVFSFDPSSMTMWFDPTIISKNGNNEYIEMVINHALNADIDSAVAALSHNRPNDWEYRRAVELVSCIWHEQKHFFDFALTSYGSYRVRQYFELYINITSILKDIDDNKSVIYFPLDSGLDQVRRAILDINSSELIETLGKAILRRKDFSKTDRFTVLVEDVPYEFGGEAQLEGLAYLTQLTAIQEYCGEEDSINIQRSAIKANQRYTWFVNLLHHFGLNSAKVVQSKLIIDPSFILPVLYASLFSRFFDDPHEGGSRMDVPAYRLFYFLKEISKKQNEYGAMDLLGRWDYVNKMAKSKWGKTIIEEFEYDLRKEEQLYESFAKQPHIFEQVKKCFYEYHTLRQSIFELFKADPLMIVDPVIFVKTLLRDICPIPVVAYPHGVAEPMPNWKRVLGYQLGELNWNWAFMPNEWKDNVKFLALNRVNDWAFIVSYLGPIAKLFLNGRNHKTMLGPELIVAQKMLEANQWKIKFDPLFEFPEEKNMMSHFYYLTNNGDAKCDLCAAPVVYPEGHTISPWVFRYSVQNGNLGIHLYGGKQEGYNRFIRDWSMWIACDSCFNAVKSNYDWRD